MFCVRQQYITLFPKEVFSLILKDLPPCFEEVAGTEKRSTKNQNHASNVSVNFNAFWYIKNRAFWKGTNSKAGMKGPKEDCQQNIYAEWCPWNLLLLEVSSRYVDGIIER